MTFTTPSKKPVFNVALFIQQTLFIYFVSVLSWPISVMANEPLLLSGSDSAMDHFIYVTILKPTYASLGIRTKFSPLPSSRSLQNANLGISDGEIARITGINKKFENLIPVPVVIMRSKIYALSLNKRTIKNWKDVSKYKVAYRRGIQVIKSALNKYNVPFSVVNKDLDLLYFLLKKRTDIIIQDKSLAISSMIKIQADGIDISPIQFLEPALIEVSLYHYLNKKNQHLVMRVTEALMRMNESGELNRRIDQYYSQLMKGLSASNEAPFTKVINP